MSWKRFILRAATEATAGFFQLTTRLSHQAFYWTRAEDPNYLLWLLGHRRRFGPPAAPTTAAPLFSILMPAYDTRPEWLADTLHSVRRQTFERWELIIVDDASPDASTRAALHRLSEPDPRIRLLINTSNQGIAASTNQAVDQARADWLLLLDHDDLLYPDALATFAAARAEHPDADLLYADEDRLSPRGLHYRYDFKPAFSPSALEMCNYILHPLCIRRTVWQRVGGMRPAFDGSQDYDLLLRLWDAGACIRHVPGMLYTWRESSASMAGGAAKPYIYRAGRQALAEHLQRRGETGVVGDNPETEPGDYRIQLLLPERPRLLLISEATPTMPEHWALEQIAPGTDPLAAALSSAPERHHAVVFLEKNLSAPDWTESLGELIGWCRRSDVGVVGGRVLDGQDCIIHAGQSLTPDGRLRDDFRGRPSGDYPDTRRLRDCLSVSGVLAIAGPKLRELATGASADSWALALCLGSRKRGWRVVYNPFAWFRHTGGVPSSPVDDAIRRLLILHGIERDPYLNPQLASLHWNDHRLPLQWPPADRLAAWLSRNRRRC